MAKKLLSRLVDYQESTRSFERPTGPSQTLPDESYTIMELFEKFASGIDPGVLRQTSTYENSNIDSIDFEKFRNMDPTEQEEILTQHKHYVTSLEHTFQQERERRKQAAEEAQRQAEIKKAEDAKRSAKDEAPKN